MLPLLGAKEGLAHLCLAQLDPGDVALVADPGYPVYYGGPALAGAEAIGLPLRAEHGFLPDLDGIAEADSRRAGLLICGYPNNPTGAVADVAVLRAPGRLGRERGVPICHDNAYAELTYDGLVAPSFLAAPGAREAGIEIYSLSKSLSLPGWRIAFAVGNAELIGRLRTLKTNIDSGMWLALQNAAMRGSTRSVLHGGPARALRPPPRRPLRRAGGTRARRSCARAARSTSGCASRTGAARWPSPSACSSRPPSWSGPGAAYGPASDGYVRLSLTAPEARLAEAVERIAAAL